MAVTDVKGYPLKFQAEFDKKKAEKSLRDFLKDIQAINKGASMKPASQSMDEYISKTKQLGGEAGKSTKEVDSLTKAAEKQKKVSADRSASLAFQEALRKERLERAQISTEIARNRLEQQKLNAAKKESATIKMPALKSNSQSEIDTYKRGQQGSLLYTSAIQRERVERAKLNAEAAKQAVANNTLTLSAKSYISTSKQQTAATQKVVLSKKQLAQMLAEEKLRQANATRELRNNAKEMLNSKGSIDQRKGALERLILTYRRLSNEERSSASGQRLANIIKGLREQIKQLEGETKSSGGNVSSFFDKIKNGAIRILGPLALLTAAWTALQKAFSHNVEISDVFTDVQRTAKLGAREVDLLGEQLKKINTRTSLEGLLDTGFEGGRLGVQKDELVEFITTVDQLSVVLKKELPGGSKAVAESLGKISIVYKIAEREGVTLAEAMNKVASSQLELAHSGPVTVKYLQDFTLGLAGTAATAKLSLPVIEAYGAVLGGAGQIASSAGLALTRVVNDLSIKREKYFAIAQLEDANLTLEKFTDLINNDTKAALDLFFKGLVSGNATQTELADRLNTVGIRTGKVSNAVKILAANNKLLADKVDIATKSYAEATSVSRNFELANNSLAASFDKITNSIANFFTDSKLSRRLAELLNSMTDNRSEAQKLHAEYESLKHQFDSTNQVINPLLVTYNELKGRTNLNKDEQEKLKTVIQQIADLIPEAVTRYNEFGVAIDINKDKIKELTEAQRELLDFKNKDLANKVRGELKEYNGALKLAIEEQEDFKERVNKGRDILDVIMDFGSGENTRKVNMQRSKEAITEMRSEIYDRIKILRDSGITLTKEEKKFLDNIEKVRTKTTSEIIGDGTLSDLDSDTTRTTEVIKQEIKDLEAANKKLDVGSKELKNNVIKLKALRKELKEALGEDTTSSRRVNEFETAIKRRNDLQSKIDELNKKSTREQLSRDEEEVQSIKDKYAKIKETVDNFYKDSRNKGLKVDVSGLAAAEKGAISDLTYRQDTEKYLKALEEQKAAFANFEDFKKQFGEKAAKERYSTELDGFKSYSEKLTSEINSMYQITGTRDLTGSEQDRLKKLIEIRKNAQEEDFKNRAAMYVETYKAALTQSHKIEQIERDHQQALKELGASISTEQRAVLEASRKEAIDAVNDEAAQKLEVFKTLYEDLDYMAEESARNAIKHAQDQLDELVSNGKISSKLAKQIRRDLSTATSSVDKRLPDGLKDVASSLQSISSEVGGVNEGFGQMLNTVSGIIGGVGNIYSALEKIKSSGLAKDGLGILSGGLGLLGAGAGIISGIAGIFQKISAENEARAAKQREYALDIQLKQTEAVTKAIERQLQLVNDVYGTDRIDKFKQSIVDLNSEFSKNASSLNNSTKYLMTGDAELDKFLREFNATGKWSGQLKSQEELIRKGIITPLKTTIGSIAESEEELLRLQKLIDQGLLDDVTSSQIQSLIQQADLYKEAVNGLRAELTGTSIESIADEIVDMFSKGTIAAEDFANSFESIMRKSLLNTFKQDLLQKELQKFYKDFAEASEGGLSKNEVNKLREEYQQIIENAQKQFEELEKVGIDLTDGGSSGGISSGIQGITETTANRLEAEFGGLRLAQLQLVEITMQQFESIRKQEMYAFNNINTALQIERNTFRTAENTQHLSRLANIETAIVALNNKISNADAARRGAGL